MNGRRAGGGGIATSHHADINWLVSSSEVFKLWGGGGLQKCRLCLLVSCAAAWGKISKQALVVSTNFFLYPMKIPIDQYFLMDIVHFKVRLRSQTSELSIIGILSCGGNFKISRNIWHFEQSTAQSEISMWEYKIGCGYSRVPNRRHRSININTAQKEHLNYLYLKFFIAEC